MSKNRKTFVFIVQPNRKRKPTARIFRVMQKPGMAHKHVFAGLVSLRSLSTSREDVIDHLRDTGRIRDTDKPGDNFLVDAI